MIVETAPHTLARMFRRPPKSSADAPALELLAPAELSDPADLQPEHLKQWRDAAKRVVRTYNAWCAAGWRDRQDLYLSFLDALRCEDGPPGSSSAMRQCSAPQIRSPETWVHCPDGETLARVEPP